MKLRIFGTCALLLLSLTASAAKKTSIQIINKSQWDIHHLYLAPHSSDKWGPDQLGKRVLKTDDDFTVTEIPCGKYDIKIVDEDGDECVIENQRLCGEEGSELKITDEELLACEDESGDPA